MEVTNTYTDFYLIIVLMASLEAFADKHTHGLHTFFLPTSKLSYNILMKIIFFKYPYKFIVFKYCNFLINEYKFWHEGTDISKEFTTRLFYFGRCFPNASGLAAYITIIVSVVLYSVQPLEIVSDLESKRWLPKDLKSNS